MRADSTGTTKEKFALNVDSNAAKVLIASAAGILAVGFAIRTALRITRRLALKGKVVLITGGSRGLGLVLAREFARRGSRVAICARKEAELEGVRNEFTTRGIPLFTGVCDVGSRADVTKLVEGVREALGEIDVLVNNAGTIVVGPVENQDSEVFEDAMQTNFWGAFFATSAVVDRMKRRRTGRIVNIASIGGKIAFPHLLPYSVSKFALVGYSEGLRAELSKYNVLVTTVCPGLMRTGSPRNADFTGQTQKEYAWFKVGDSMPIVSTDAVKAAKQIIGACINGDAELHVGITAKLGAMMQGVAPNATAELLSVVDRVMPDAFRGRPAHRKGFESESAATKTSATQLTREAEVENNQR